MGAKKELVAAAAASSKHDPRPPNSTLLQTLVSCNSELPSPRAVDRRNFIIPAMHQFAVTGMKPIKGAIGVAPQGAKPFFHQYEPSEPSEAGNHGVNDAAPNGGGGGGGCGAGSDPNGGGGPPNEALTFTARDLYLFLVLLLILFALISWLLANSPFHNVY